jgi:hypothetical protein
VHESTGKSGSVRGPRPLRLACEGEDTTTSGETHGVDFARVLAGRCAHLPIGSELDQRLGPGIVGECVPKVRTERVLPPV